MNNESLSKLKNTIIQENEHIWIKPICDFFELSYKNCRRNINDDLILSNQSTKMPNESLFGDKRSRITLTKKGFIRWIQLVSANDVRSDLQDQFRQYQSLVFDFLYGSVQQNRQTKVLYARFSKLKRLKKKINRELRSIQKQLESRWDRRYLQGTFQFEPLDEPTVNED